LQEGINAFAKFAGIAAHLACLGEPDCPVVQCRSPGGEADPALLARLQTEAARRGIRIRDVHHLTEAHDVAAIERTLQAYAGVFRTLAKLKSQGNSRCLARR
jgi:hypothetical protein